MSKSIDLDYWYFLAMNIQETAFISLILIMVLAILAKHEEGKEPLFSEGFETFLAVLFCIGGAVLFVSTIARIWL